jgi:small conductance mechanosensitive channel
VEQGLKLLAEKLHRWLFGIIQALPNLLVAIILLLLFFFAAKFLRNFSRKIFSRIFRNKSAEGLLANIVFSIVFITGIFISLGILNLDKTVTSLLAGAGIVGLALSFAFQDVAQNFISGISMAVWRPFNIGDTVETVGGRRGIIKKLNLRTTVLMNSAGEMVIVPNKEIHQNVLVNSSMAKGVLVRIPFDIPAGQDLGETKELITETLRELGSIADHAVSILFTEMQGTTVKAEVRFFVTRGEDNEKAKSDAIFKLKKAFDLHQLQAEK